MKITITLRISTLSTMPSYTIHYFNHRGRAEVCRMLLAAAGVKYNDRRIESSEWAVMRECS